MLGVDQSEVRAAPQTLSVVFYLSVHQIGAFHETLHVVAVLDIQHLQESLHLVLD